MKEMNVASREDRGDSKDSLDLALAIERFTPLIRSLAWRYQGNGAEREDLEQEARVAIIRIIAAHGYDNLALNLKRHLRGYVRDAASRLRNRPGDISLFMGDDDDDDVLLYIADPRNAEDIERIEFVDILERALPQPLLEIALAYLRGDRQCELARALGVSHTCIQHRMFRARNILKHLMIS